MPRIEDRITSYEAVLAKAPVTPVDQPIHGNPAVLQTSTINNFMSVGGNSVPMRGVLPIEQMTDTDLYRFYPYSAYMDRMWAYTYFALANRT